MRLFDDFRRRLQNDKFKIERISKTHIGFFDKTTKELKATFDPEMNVLHYEGGFYHTKQFSDKLSKL